VGQFDRPTSVRRPFPTTDRHTVGGHLEDNPPHGDARHALNALVAVPEYARRLVGTVELLYVDHRYNTAKTFAHFGDNVTDLRSGRSGRRTMSRLLTHMLRREF
jgi:hypothetical protein